MRRIYAFYLLRMVSNGAPSRVVLLTLSLAGLFSSVSVGSVFKNMPNVSDLGGIYAFYLSALSNAEVFVKVVVLLLLVSGLLIVRDVVHTIRRKLASSRIVTSQIARQKI